MEKANGEGSIDNVQKVLSRVVEEARGDGVKKTTLKVQLAGMACRYSVCIVPNMTPHFKV